MRTIILALTVMLAGAAVGCSPAKKAAASAPSCALSQLGASCTQGAECCSGSCTNSTCVEPIGSCGNLAAPCATPSECCSGACSGTCVDPASCEPVGSPCATAEECCTYACEGALGAKQCVEPVGQCAAVGGACSTNPDCCNGNCVDAGGGTKTCTAPTSGTCSASGSCTAATEFECCSGVCGTGNTCLPAQFCEIPGAACSSDAQCCSVNCTGGTCSSTVCRQVGQPCASGGACCSGVCGADSKCAVLPSGSTGATCRTLGEVCAFGGDCCSTNCQGGTCKPAYTCNASGDICYGATDCCSGLCAPPAGAGQPGRCEDAPGGCALDGYPCTSDSGCCTRRCVDLGTGAKVCQPSGGCRLNGNYCDSTAACCNVNHLIAESKEVDCDPVDHVCTNGGACNPPGDICGLNANASQNCCFGKKDVCRYDSNGIPRCFGGPPGHCDGNGCDETCPIGWDGNDPQCCIPPGTGPESICQFRDQCCGFAPCVPDATGVLHCAAVTTCKPQGSPCAGAGDTSCCTGSTCQDLGSELEWRCADAGGGIGCDPIGAGCASNVDCCSGVCDPVNDVCVAACVAGGGACTVGADCCAGLACDIAPGATSGVCNDPDGGGGPTCAATGQGCAISADCCNDATGEDCIAGVCTVAASTCSETYQVCTVDANCCGDLQCYGLTDLEAQRPCGDPGIVGACFCDVPPAYSCIEETQPCSSILPCCPTQPLYCGSKAAGGGPCTSTNTADCECKPVG